VASALAGIPDVVEHDVHGLLVAPGDVAALAGALARLAGDPGLRARLGGAARARAAAELTWGHVAERLEASYVEAAALDAA
jgi:2-deoxystreptamine N-acetyl-D-glucosaminyltransferase/2-deoxystreptamine glucosyltransferase